MNKGYFIVIEGTDGSGKATQTKLLQKTLEKQGKEVFVIDFPQYETPTGKVIQSYLYGKFGDPTLVSPKDASMFYAADRWASARKIRKALDSGKIVIADRYMLSNLAHQGAKIDKNGERFHFYSSQSNEEFEENGIPKPDLTFFLDVPIEVSQQLMGEQNRKKDGHESNTKYLSKVYECYLELCGIYKIERIECASGQNLKSINEINEKLVKIVNNNLGA